MINIVMKQPAIKATNIGLQKQSRTILNNLSVEIKPGVITGLIGPSGAGKTTLMRVILGLQRVNGEIEVLQSSAGCEDLRSRIGYVSQQPSIYSDLTVEQNLHYFASLINASSEQVKKVIQEVDLAPQTKQIVSTLSGGQRARVSLATALLGKPELLILDEPTVGLDPILRNNLWRLFQKLADSGKTLLISSHVMDEAERCQNLVLLRDGKSLWQGGKNELLNGTKVKNVEAAFLKLASGGDK